VRWPSSNAISRAPLTALSISAPEKETERSDLRRRGCGADDDVGAVPHEPPTPPYGFPWFEEP
jgi:hypothetical protein